MSSLFQTIDKIKPVYDRTYALVMFLCKLLLTVDILYGGCGTLHSVYPGSGLE